MTRVIHRQDSYPDNAGHWQRSVALAVLLTKVSVRLRKELASTFGKPRPHPRQHQSRPEIGTGIRGVLDDRERFDFASGSRHLCQIHGPANYPMMSRGAADRCWVCGKEPESKRRRLSVNKGTSEARLSMAVTPLGRSSNRPKHLPMRQPSGGAPVVVGDVNNAHMAKGCRMIRVWMTEVFFNLEASK
jgi:hypothetical protein